VYDLVGVDQIEAARQIADDVNAQVLGSVLIVAVKQRADARLPGATLTKLPKSLI